MTTRRSPTCSAVGIRGGVSASNLRGTGSLVCTPISGGSSPRIRRATCSVGEYSSVFFIEEHSAGFWTRSAKNALCARFNNAYFSQAIWID
jgi:hypothetical protein